MKTLDRKRPYGVISGCNEGRVYEQDNAFFNGDGSEWTSQEEEAEEKPAKAASTKPAALKKAGPVKAVKPAPSQLDDQLQNQ